MGAVIFATVALSYYIAILPIMLLIIRNLILINGISARFFIQLIHQGRA